MISSQNHGFAVDEASLPANVRVTHRSLFDQSNQGIALDDAPAFSFQGHPEASPGPHDVAGLFDRFFDHGRTARAPEEFEKRPRVRLLRRAGLQGAARRGLPGHPGELQSGHDHDRPGDGRRHLYRAHQVADRRAIIEVERPDALLPTMGGQTALNCALDLARKACCDKFGVEMIGATKEAIDKAEDREKFKARR
jgi:hypothetical protein